MNLGVNYFARSTLLAYPDKIRIGRAHNIGRPYYNLEIKTRYLRDERNIYKSMIETIDRLINPEPAQESNSIT